MENGVTITRIAASIAAVGAALVLSCAGPTRFIDPEADLPYYQTVGVIPFTSLALDGLAGHKVADIFFTELLHQGFAQVIEPGVLAAAMVRARGGNPPANPWSAAELAKLGEEIGAQGFFMGAVRDYGMERVGRDEFPLVSIQVRLVDAATGRVVWTASQTRRGGPAFPIFGWGEIHTLGELVSKVCRELLDPLPRGQVR